MLSKATTVCLFALTKWNGHGKWWTRYLRQFSLEQEFIQSYRAGSWGPEEASQLFDSSDQRWRNHI